MNRKREIWVPVNLADLFFTATELYPNNEALKYKIGHHYHKMTYLEVKKEVIKLAIALKRLGISEGDRAIIISENRPEWVITDLALVCLGAVNVPIHSVLSSSQLADIIKEIKPSAIFFSDHEQEAKLLDIAGDISGIDSLISYENGENGLKKIHYFKDLIDRTKVNQEDEAELIENIAKIKPETIASIIYTSGTTGHLKGVMLTHQNFIQDIVGVLEHIWAYPEDRFFSVLPLSHVFERTAGYYVPFYCGASIGYSLDIANLSTEIKERKPTIVIAVPRLFEKIHEKIMENVNKNLFKKSIFRLAFGLKIKGKDSFLNKVFDQLVFAKIRNEFGGEVRFFVSGGAALPARLGKFFERVGLIVLEGYGLTETSPVIAVNRLNDFKFGSVGVCLSNIDVKIGEAGEILVKGPIVTPGYLRDEDNKASFEGDWFKTGDIGYFDRNGFLVITGRKKDLLVLTTGKKVAPVPIEEALEANEFIDQAMVFGEARKHVAALIVPNYTKLAERFGIEGRERIRKNQDIFEFMSEQAKEATKSFASIERIKKFILVNEPFSVENGEMTPTLKLRRHVIFARYEDEIDKLYEL
jgi:long-chain acyl-CoA synthetase